MLEAGAPTGLRAFTRGGYFGKPDRSTFEALHRRGLESPDPTGVHAFALALTYFGGAITEDFDEDAMAFSRENGTALLEIISIWESRDLDQQALNWVDKTIEAVRSDILPNGYINLTCDNSPEWVRQIYGKTSKYERLVAAKAKWDPDNLLRFNRNILPALT